MKEKIKKYKIKQKREKFVFWKTFVNIFFVTLIVIALWYVFTRSFKEHFFGSLPLILFFLIPLTIVFTFFIKWFEEYKSQKKK